MTDWLASTLYASDLSYLMLSARPNPGRPEATIAELPSEETTRLRTDRAIGKVAPGQRWERHPQLFMPLLPNLLRKHASGSVLKHFSEFFCWHVLLGYSYIRRGAVNH